MLLGGQTLALALKEAYCPSSWGAWYSLISQGLRIRDEAVDPIPFLHLCENLAWSPLQIPHIPHPGGNSTQDSWSWRDVGLFWGERWTRSRNISAPKTRGEIGSNLPFSKGVCMGGKKTAMKSHLDVTQKKHSWSLKKLQWKYQLSLPPGIEGLAHALGAPLRAKDSQICIAHAAYMNILSTAAQRRSGHFSVFRLRRV